MNLERLYTLDRIVLDRQGFEKMNKWHQSIRQKEEPLDIPFYEGLVVLAMNDVSAEDVKAFRKGGLHSELVKEEDEQDMLARTQQKELHIYFHFGEEDSVLTAMQLEYDKQSQQYDPLLSFTCDLSAFAENPRFAVRHYFQHVKLQEEDMQKHALSAFDILMKALYFVGNYEGEVKVSERRITRIKKGKAKAGKPSKRRVVKVGVKTYSFPQEEKDGNRDYRRHIESWRVRGHWRVYKKTGKRVWISPHVKGEGTVQGKEYTV